MNLSLIRKFGMIIVVALVVGCSDDISGKYVVDYKKLAADQSSKNPKFIKIILKVGVSAKIAASFTCPLNALSFSGEWASLKNKKPSRGVVQEMLKKLGKRKTENLTSVVYEITKNKIMWDGLKHSSEIKEGNILSFFPDDHPWIKSGKRKIRKKGEKDKHPYWVTLKDGNVQFELRDEHFTCIYPLKEK